MIIKNRYPLQIVLFLITELYSNDGGDEMEQYAWLEPKHDPIVRDTNFAEIDFENFKNDDLAYAFSCGVSSNSWIMFLFS